MKKDILNINVFNGDDGIKYIRYDDMISMLNRIKEDNEERDKEIERLNNIINTSIDKVQEVKDHIDKSKFDGTTKSILIMALNEIIYSLNGKGVDKG